jgi:NAD(P)H-nitrite reductase large subunit
MNVSDARLRQAIRDGATTVAAIRAATRASCGCGTCRPDLLRILAEELGDDATNGDADADVGREPRRSG